MEPMERWRQMVHVKCRPSGERSCCSLDLSAERYEARYLEQDFHDPAYRNVLSRSFAIATVAAVLWKVGPISEATIGHVGLYPTVNKWGVPIRDGNRSGLNDYVANEAIGIPLMVCEDWLDKHVARPLEGHTHSRARIDTIRLFTSPTRSFANLMAFHRPWLRENRD